MTEWVGLEGTTVGHLLQLPAQKRKRCHLRTLLFTSSQPVGLWNKRDGSDVNFEDPQHFFCFGRSHLFSLINGRVKTHTIRYK